MFIMASNSIGVTWPIRACLRRRWYVRSIQITIARRSSWRVVHERLLRTFFCNRLKNDSIAVLSPQEGHVLWAVLPCTPLPCDTRLRRSGGLWTLRMPRGLAGPEASGPRRSDII